MDMSEHQLGMLRTVGQFERIERYGCLMPSKHVHVYKEKDVETLVKGGFLEWAVLVSNCGAQFEGVRLTDNGRELVYGDGGIPSRLCNIEMPMPLVAILVDIHSFSRIRRYKGMMPSKKAGSYPASDIDDLYRHGYILRMKIKGPGGKKKDGFVLSHKGRALLRSMDLIEPLMHLAGRPDLALA